EPRHDPRAASLRALKEPLNESHADCVAGKMRMNARRATKVVAWATMPRSATKQAPHFAATGMGRGFSGGLLCRETRQWGLPLASPRLSWQMRHPIPKSRRRNRAGLVQRFPV